MKNQKTKKKVLLFSNLALESLAEFAKKRYTNRTSAINLILSSINDIKITKEMLEYNRSPANKICVNVDYELWEVLREKSKKVSLNLGKNYPMSAVLDAIAIEAKNILK